MISVYGCHNYVGQNIVYLLKWYCTFTFELL